MTIKEAFKNYKDGELTDLEIRIFIKEITNDHESEKLKELKKALDSYVARIRRKIKGNPNQIISFQGFSIQGFPLPYNMEEVVKKYWHMNLNELKETLRKLEEEFRSYEVDNIIKNIKKKEENKTTWDEQEARKVIYLLLIAISEISEKHGEATINAIFDLDKLKKLEELIDGLLHKSEKPLLTKDSISRDYIFEYCRSLKEDGMTVVNMFEKVENLLLTELNFTREEVKERFNFSLNEPYHFNKFLSNHI